MIASSEFYKVPSIALRGILVSTVRNTKCCKFAFRFGWKFWCLLTLMFSMIFLQIIYCYQSIAVPDNFDISKFCFAVSCVLYESIVFAKILSMSVAGNELSDLFVLLDEIHPKTIESQVQYNIHGWLLKTKRLMKQYCLMLSLMIANYAIIPICIQTKVLIETGRWTMELMLSQWWPFETESTFPFTFVYLVQSALGFMVISSSTASDTSLLAVIQLVSAHFNFIQRTYEQIKPDSPMNDLNTIKRCVVLQNILNE